MINFNYNKMDKHNNKIKRKKVKKEILDFLI